LRVEEVMDWEGKGKNGKEGKGEEMREKGERKKKVKN